MHSAQGAGGLGYGFPAALGAPGPRVLVLPALLRRFAPTHTEAVPAP